MDKTRKDGGPAFPIPHPTDYRESVPGMSLRMWLAAKAPMEIVSGAYKNLYRETGGSLDIMPDERLLRADAKARLMWADAMLAEAQRSPSD